MGELKILPLFGAMDTLRRRSEPGLSSETNDAEGDAIDRGEEGQQVPAAQGGQQVPPTQALMDGRDVARAQLEFQGKSFRASEHRRR